MMQEIDAANGVNALETSSLSVLKTGAVALGVTTTAWLLLPPPVMSDSSSVYLSQALEVLGEAVCSSSFQSVAAALVGLCLYPGARNLSFWSSKQTRGVSISDQDVGSDAASFVSGAVLGLPALHKPRKQHLNKVAPDHRHHRHSQQQDQKQQQEQQQEQEQQQAGQHQAHAPADGQSPLQRSRSLDLEERASRRSMEGGGSRRAMPSLQVELNPLPRLSLDFKRNRRGHQQHHLQHQQHNQQAQQQQQQAGAGLSKWRPSMARIASGQDLAVLAAEASSTAAAAAAAASTVHLTAASGSSSSSSSSSSALLPSPFASTCPPPTLNAPGSPGAVSQLSDQASIDLFYDACSQLTAKGHPASAAAAPLAEEEATACLEYASSPLLPGQEAVGAALGDVELLQLGSVLGERGCQAALRSRGMAPAVGGPGALYGMWDTEGFHGGWEAVVHEGCEGLRYWAWRRPLRKGLYMYMTKAVLEGASAGELRQFMLDDQLRRQWDDSTLELHVRSHAGAAVREYCESAVLYARTKFPAPMSSRDYVYARRVWNRSSDGGCYCISRCLPELPGAPGPQGRAVRVQDSTSGYVIKAAHSRQGGPAAEMVMVYYEDSQVRAGIINLAIRKGLWTLMQKTNTAFRGCQQRLKDSATAAAAAAAVAAAAEAEAAASRLKQEQQGAEQAERSKQARGWRGAARGWLSAAASAAKGLVQDLCDTVAAAGRAVAEVHSAMWSCLGSVQLHMLAALGTVWRPWLSAATAKRGHELNAQNLRYLQALQQQQALQLTHVYSWPAPQQLQQQQRAGARADSATSSRPSSRSGARATASSSNLAAGSAQAELLMWERAIASRRGVAAGGGSSRALGSVADDTTSCSASVAGSEASSAQRRHGRQGRGRRLFKKVVQAVGIKVAHTLLSISAAGVEQAQLQNASRANSRRSSLRG